MKHHEAFNQSHASLYDEQWKKLAPMTGGLHFLIKILLKNLPEDAHILCVGAGSFSVIWFFALSFGAGLFSSALKNPNTMKYVNYSAAGIMAYLGVNLLRTL